MSKKQDEKARGTRERQNTQIYLDDPDKAIMKIYALFYKGSSVSGEIRNMLKDHIATNQIDVFVERIIINNYNNKEFIDFIKKEKITEFFNQTINNYNKRIALEEKIKKANKK